MRPRMLGVALIVVGVAGLVGMSWTLPARVNGLGWGPMAWSGLGDARRTLSCSSPTLPGQTVDVVLSDMRTMMGGEMMVPDGPMMYVAAHPSKVASGSVSFLAWNQGMMLHELVILPLPPGGPGTRAVAPDGRVSEAGSLGEASKSCSEGPGDGIAPGAISWVSLHLSAGRYELICNEPGHYAMGMFTEIDVG